MYRIIGADGRQYGPISADQIRRWITEGRANAQTRTLAEGAAEWKPLGSFPEFAAYFTPQAPPPINPVTGSHLRTTNSFAIWGMVFGILAIVCCCPKILFGALGLIFSLVALSQINERPDFYEGRGYAIAGIVLSALGLLFALSSILFALAWHPEFNPGYHYHHF
ncbi:MAG TPA: DUF4190 domain-containing protein [Pseudomonadales bacterium]|nr:DUF4190 domain-containing protein [Pseudomonadales bacterium]